MRRITLAIAIGSLLCVAEAQALIDLDPQCTDAQLEDAQQRFPIDFGLCRTVMEQELLGGQGSTFIMCMGGMAFCCFDGGQCEQMTGRIAQPAPISGPGQTAPPRSRSGGFY
jgi:hypothetical protein